MVDSSSPFDLLKEEMSNDDTQIKVNAIHRLSIVLAYLAPDKIVGELIPYLNKLISTEEDEVLLAISENLSKFKIYLKEDKFVSVFPIFQTLLCAEETVVRDNTVESLREIIKNLSDEVIYTHILPIIYNISSQENFTGKVSAVYMVRMVYQKSGKDKEKVRSIYFKLCDEDLPLIKRAAAKEFGQLCMVMEKEVVNPDMINYFKKFMNESDSIRVLLLNSLIYLVKLFQNSDLQRINVQVVVAASDDKSWRVRHELAKIFPQLIDGFGSQIQELIPTFSSLIKDSETEVKIAALEGLETVIKNISSDKVIVCIIPAILSLQTESSFHVKSLIGQSLGAIAKSVGYSTYSVKLGATFEALMKDENTDVRIGVSKSVYDIFISSEQALFSSVNSILGVLQKDNQYKIRENVLTTLGNLGCTYGLETFKQHFETLFFNYLTDSVASVRETGVSMLETLTKSFGSNWTTGTLIPKLTNYLAQQTKTSFLYRVAVLHSIAICAKNLAPNLATEYVLQNLIKNLKDKIPNVRFFLIKILTTIFSFLDSTGKEKAKM